MRSPLTCLLFALLLCVAAPSGAWAASSPEESPSDVAVATEDEAIEAARDDELTSQLLDLRTGLDPEVSFQRASSKSPDRWLIQWNEGSTLRIVTTVEQESGRVASQGQGLVVMPGTRAEAIVDLARPWLWLPLLVGFSACLWMAPGGRRGRILLTPLLVASAAFIVMLLDVVPASSIRSGNLAIFAVVVASILALAVLLVRAARDVDPSELEPAEPDAPSPASSERRSLAVGAVVALVAAVMLIVGSVSARETTDVAVASTIGASLMGDGVPVYGNIMDLPGIVEYADTYGPLSYLPYVPAVKLTDRPVDVVLPTNVVLALLVAGLVFLIGRRRSAATGVWAAAAWLSCPLVALGVVFGNNDVVVALLVAALVLVLGNPAGRGAVVALAAATKFLPVALLALVLRFRGETTGAARAAAAGFLGATVAIWVIALRGTTAVEAFWDRAVVGQAERDDLASLWGLAGIGPARLVPIAAAVALAAWSVRLAWQRGPGVVAPMGAAILALLIAALPLTWPTYVTWIVPLVLATAIGPVTARTTGPRPADPEVSAARRAGALPSSTAP